MNRSKLVPILLLSGLAAAGCDGHPAPLTAPSSPQFAGFSGSAQQLNVHENFNLKAGETPAKLEVTGAGAPDYANGFAEFNVFRTYLRTIANYDGSSFKADVTVSVLSLANPDGIAFIGFGSGVPTLGWPNEPNAANVWARLLPDGFHGGGIDVQNGASDYSGIVAGQGGTGTHRVRLTWDASTREVTFAIHSDWVEGSEFTPTVIYGPAVVGNDIDASNSHIFIGGALMVRFDDLHVVVKPSK